MKHCLSIIFCLISLNFSLKAMSFAEWTDDYETLLKKYVHIEKNGEVVNTSIDYKALRSDPLRQKLYKELYSLPRINTLKFRQKLAFWLNAYNFLAINKVAENPSIKKLTDLSRKFKSVWKQNAGMIRHKEYSLDGIEHGIIRKQFKEPLVHFALVCAAKSSPNIRNEAYKADKLNEQLQDQLKQFVANPQKGMKLENKTIYLSKIFTWFANDFPGGPVAWLEKRQFISRNVRNNYKLKYLDYDWNINSYQKKENKK